MSEPTGPSYFDPLTQERFDLGVPMWRGSTGNPLMITPLPGINRRQINLKERSIWRYGAALPVAIPSPLSLGEGCTPLVQGRFGDVNCRFKLEWFSPTGSFKDRGASVLISFLKQQGITAVVEDSSGNGGAAIAAYGAAAGMAVTIVTPASTQPSKLAQIQAYGAQIVLVPGPREATEDAAIKLAEETFYASHNWHPMFLQGTKTLGYEIWEDLGFQAPDNIIIPSSAGSNVLGCHIAFAELMRQGEISKLPRIFVSQPKNCAPLHASFQAGADGFVETEFAPTIAEGTAIKQPIRLRQMLEALRETDGGTVAVTEEEIVDAAFALARQGLYVEPTSAHAAAGLHTLVAQNLIHRDDETVVVLTGTGLKATSFYASTFSD